MTMTPVVLFPAAADGASLDTQAFIGVSNDPYSDAGYVGVEGNSSVYSNTGAPVMASGSGSYSGLNHEGNSSTLIFSGAASASATYGQLHTKASGSITNAFYNPENPGYHYYDPESDSVIDDPNGVPTFFHAHGQARYSDQLTYSDTSGAVTVNFYFQITGSFTGTHVSHSIYVTFGEESDYILLTPQDGGQIGQTWVTQKFSITPGQPITHSVAVLSQFDFMAESDGTGDYEGTADFFNTITMIGMELYDENGHQVDGWTLSSASGTVYPTAAPIPEPGTVALLGLSMAALAYSRRRFSRMAKN